MNQVLVLTDATMVPVCTRSLAAYYGDLVLIWWDGNLLSAVVGTLEHRQGIAIDDDGAYLRWAARSDVRAVLAGQRDGLPVRLCRLNVAEPGFVVVFWRSENAGGDVAAVCDWAEGWKILERETRRDAVPTAP
jgi:hypothetical protein